MASAAWLFAGEVGAAQGVAGVEAMRDDLGRAWPVLDAVCANWIDGRRDPDLDPREVAALLADASRVAVGIEADWLDALVAALPATTRVGLVQYSASTWKRCCSCWPCS